MKNNKKRQPHYSPVKFIKQLQTESKNSLKNNQFVPYQNQRDNLGRLIVQRPNKIILEKIKNNQKLNKQQSPQLKHADTADTCQTQIDKVKIIQETLNKSFQYHQAKEWKDFQNHKKPKRKNSLPFLQMKYSVPKILIQNQSTCQNTRKRYGSYDFTDKYTKQQTIISPLRINLMVQKNKKDNLDAKLNNLNSNVYNKKIGQVATKIIYKLQNNKPDKIFNLNYIKQDISQLNEYNTRNRLSFKLKQGLEYSHKQFLTKMIQTKQLAYKIKVQLQQS